MLKRKAEIIVRHIMRDGSEVKSIAGKEVKAEGAIKHVIAQINERLGGE